MHQQSLSAYKQECEALIPLVRLLYPAHAFERQRRNGCWP